jgi:hypothetical protein
MKRFTEVTSFEIGRQYLSQPSFWVFYSLIVFSYIPMDSALADCGDTHRSGREVRSSQETT